MRVFKGKRQLGLDRSHNKYHILWMTNCSSDVECLAGPLEALSSKKNVHVDVYDTSKDDDESQVTSEKIAFSTDGSSGEDRSFTNLTNPTVPWYFGCAS